MNPIWLTEPQVVRINQRLVERTGEPHGLREAGLLTPAMASPMQHGERTDIRQLAGALLLGIGLVRPFVEGNRRTALTAAIIFLALNGYAFAAPDGEDLGVFVARAISGAIAETAFLRAMRDSAVTIEEWEAFHNNRLEQQ